MDYLFGRQKTAAEEARESERSLRKVDRDLERDRRKLDMEEKKIEQEIRRLAKVPGNQETVKILAKQLVQMRKQKTRSVAASSKVKSIGAQQRVMQANSRLAGAMGSAASTMAQANRAADPMKMAQTLRNFEQESAKMGMTEEMINDTLDDILNESGDEEEGDSIVAKVLDEIGIEISGQLAKAPSAAREEPGAAAKARSKADEDIESMLNRLRSS